MLFDSKANNMPTPHSERPPPNLETSESASTLLRFPAPVADERVTYWVESNMSGPSESPFAEDAFGESTYDFVDTDTESRDDNATESVASTDFGARPGDVASLADTDGDESGDEENAGDASVPALQHLDRAGEDAFNTPTIGRSAAVLRDEMDRPLAQSIEFEEPCTLGAETVSVKHTVAELGEDQTAMALKGMSLQDPPKRLVVTIRQTMTKQGLSTRDPLRILYIGSHAAKQDVIHKLAGSVTASVEGGKRARSLRSSSSHIYNVVPISAFGSEKTPEIELMHSSGYQIKVEDCTSAVNLQFEESPEKPDVIKVVLDDTFAHHSVPEGEGFVVEPPWELPHVAVFYCSDGDDAGARRTRTMARKFMNRHSIPSIVISHKQLFERGQCMSLDQHSIHMCLESRDPNGRGLIHQRLPIDLASFLNIDARQMNRNLAYLTGLYEALETKALPNVSKPGASNPRDPEKYSFGLAEQLNSIRRRHGAVLWGMLVPAAMCLLSIFAGMLARPTYLFSKTASPAMTINSKLVPAVSLSTASLVSSTSVPSITPPSPQAAKTSTKTVTVTQSVALSSGPNSLSVLPSKELGQASQPVLAKPAHKAYVCSAELQGDREILIRIPAATKLGWLAKEAMVVNITRNNATVDTERAYTSDEGILLQLPKREAYGVLNISIVTTKKPRVRETFQIDFGSSHSWQSFLSTLSSYLPEDGHFVDTQMFSHLFQAAEHTAEDAIHYSHSTLDQARKAAVDQAALASKGLSGIAKSISLEAAKRTAIVSKEVGIQLAGAKAKLVEHVVSSQSLREPLNDEILKAQIQSKLLWLKLQGKTEEYEEYQRRAAKLARSKAETLHTSRTATAAARAKQDRLAKKAAKKEARHAKKTPA